MQIHLSEITSKDQDSPITHYGQEEASAKVTPAEWVGRQLQSLDSKWRCRSIDGSRTEQDEANRQEAGVPETLCVGMSASTGDGIEALLQALESRIIDIAGRSEDPAGYLITRSASEPSFGSQHRPFC